MSAVVKQIPEKYKPKTPETPQHPFFIFYSFSQNPHFVTQNN